MKDWLLQKGTETALSVLLRDYGTVRSLSLNSIERWCEIELDLRGETQPIRVRAEDISFRTQEKQVFVRVGRLHCSREWISRLGAQLVVGREFLLPPQAAAAVRVLL